MMQITLTSTSNEIKQYFNAILKLSQSKEQYPVNLNEVWPLVYGRKQEAVRALTSENSDFIQGVDYQVLRKDAQNSNGGRPGEEYYLTVSCMEYFIARKVRNVFEVYRKVFHQSVNNRELLLNSPEMAKTRIMVAEWAIKILNVNETSKLAMVKAIAEPIGVPTPDYTEAEDIIHSATDRLTKRGLGLSAMRFNKIMVEAGLMKRASRYSKSKGKEVTWPVLTDEGKIYGENLVTPDNPRQSQPSYYDGKFDELLERLGITNN
ncbi:hypothetical protein [Bacteroides sp.]|uniref:hypothetical protein n=1 Tax=Bacteroides sp. TaxID=29523 RepID=UPI003A910387